MSMVNDEILDTRVLRAIIAVTSTGQMTGAAKRMGIGQPAITHLVKEPETALGFDLFERKDLRISL